jgi:hypothetical protein
MSTGKYFSMFGSQHDPRKRLSADKAHITEDWNLQQHLSQNIKSSAESLSQSQIFSNTAVRTSNHQQNRCHNLKSSATP